MHIIPSPEEVATKITMSFWNQNVELRARLHDDIEKYWSLVRQALSRVVEEELKKS